MGIETLAIASLVGTAVSGVTGFIGAQQQGAAAEASAKYQAQVARNNETIAAQNAQYSAAAAGTQAQANDMKERATLGGILAAQGASGLDVDGGSSRDVREAARRIGRLDTETIYSNALQSARSSLTQATGFEAQSRLSDMQAKNSSNNLAAFGSLLGGATSFSDKWLRYRTPAASSFI